MSNNQTTDPLRTVPPGDWRQLSSAILVYIAAALGGLFAAIADVVQKEEASAVAKLTSLSARLLNVIMEPTWILALLVILATALCFVFQPKDRKQGFMVGLGIIAGVMTVTPYKQPLTGIPADTKAEAELNQTYYQNAALITVQDNGTLSKPTLLEVPIRNLGNTEALIGVSVYDPRTGQEYYQKNVVYGQNVQTFTFNVPGATPGNEIQFTVDVDGRRLNIQSLQFGENPQPIVIDDNRISVFSEGKIDNFSRNSSGNLSDLFRKPFRW